MAFTEAQRTAIRVALGYPSLYRYQDVRLESALDVVGGRPEEATLVLGLIAKIDTIQNTDIPNALKLAGLKRAEDVEWFQGGTIPGLAVLEGKYAEGKRLVSQISIIMGVPIYGDIFGRQGYPGDYFTGRAHQFGGGILNMG